MSHLHFHARKLLLFYLTKTMHLQGLSIGVLLYKLAWIGQCAQQISLYSMQNKMLGLKIFQKETTKEVKISASNIGKPADFRIYRRKNIEFITNQKHLWHFMTNNCPSMIAWHSPFNGCGFVAV